MRGALFLILAAFAAGCSDPGKALELDLDGPIALAEFDLAAISAAVPGISAFGGMSPFPPVRQDIAVVVASDVEAAALVATAREAGGALLADVEVFDVFADADRLGADRVSLAFHLAFQADDRTLIAAFAAGRREAFDVIVERHRRHIYQLCYRFVGKIGRAHV